MEKLQGHRLGDRRQPILGSVTIPSIPPHFGYLPVPPLLRDDNFKHKRRDDDLLIMKHYRDHIDAISKDFTYAKDIERWKQDIEDYKEYLLDNIDNANVVHFCCKDIGYCYDRIKEAEIEMIRLCDGNDQMKIRIIINKGKKII